MEAVPDFFGNVIRQILRTTAKFSDVDDVTLFRPKLVNFLTHLGREERKLKAASRATLSDQINLQVDKWLSAGNANASKTPSPKGCWTAVLYICTVLEQPIRTTESASALLRERFGDIDWDLESVKLGLRCAADSTDVGNKRKRIFDDSESQERPSKRSRSATSDSNINESDKALSQNSFALTCMSVSMDEDEERSEREPQLDQGRPKRLCKQPDRFQPDMSGITDDFNESDYDKEESADDDTPLIPKDAGSEYDSMDIEAVQSDDSDYIEGSEPNKHLEEKYERQYASSEGLQQAEPAASDVPSCHAPALPPMEAAAQPHLNTSAAVPTEEAPRYLQPTLQALCSLGLPAPSGGSNIIPVPPLVERVLPYDQVRGNNTEGSHAESSLLVSISGDGSMRGPQPKHHTVEQIDVDRSPESNDSGEQADSAAVHSHESAEEPVKERIDGAPSKQKHDKETSSLMKSIAHIVKYKVTFEGKVEGSNVKLLRAKIGTKPSFEIKDLDKIFISLDGTTAVANEPAVDESSSKSSKSSPKKSSKGQNRKSMTVDEGSDEQKSQGSKQYDEGDEEDQSASKSEDSGDDYREPSTKKSKPKSGEEQALTHSDVKISDGTKALINCLSNSTVHISFKDMTTGMGSDKSFNVTLKLNIDLKLSGDLFVRAWYDRELAGINKVAALHEAATNLAQQATQKLKLKIAVKLNMFVLGSVILAMEKDMDSAIGSELSPSIAKKKRKQLVNEKLATQLCDDKFFKDLTKLNVIPPSLVAEMDAQKRANNFRRFKSGVKKFIGACRCAPALLFNNISYGTLARCITKVFSADWLQVRRVLQEKNCQIVLNDLTFHVPNDYLVPWPKDGTLPGFLVDTVS